MDDVAQLLSAAVGWAVGSSWLPPRDFEFLRWLLVPGYGYGFLLVAFALAELVMPEQKRPWTRRTGLSATYLMVSAKLGVYSLLVAPALRHLWLFVGLPSLHLDRSLPLALYIPISLLVVSFTAYWSHRWMHTVPLGWEIHKVHHAAENLSFASTSQAHFLELLFHAPTHTLATLALGTDLVAPFGLIYMAVDYLAHANIKLNMGPLTYVLCTPQAHRIHHSIERRHFDTNFGNTFMIWDHVFGTFCYDPNDLPNQYGIHEDLPTSFWKQQVLPLRDIAALLRPSKVREREPAREVAAP